MTSPIRILIVDDHPLMREALTIALEDQPDMQVLASVGDGQQALDSFQSARPDLVILDMYLPRQDGLQVMDALLACDPQARILMLTSSTDDDLAFRAFEHGALGFLRKDARRDTIVTAARQVGQGQTYVPPELLGALVGVRRAPAPILTEALTAREAQVLALIGQGLTNTAIAQQLGISDGTVRTHIYHLEHKLRLANRNQLMLYALRRA